MLSLSKHLSTVLMKSGNVFIFNRISGAGLVVNMPLYSALIKVKTPIQWEYGTAMFSEKILARLLEKEILVENDEAEALRNNILARAIASCSEKRLTGLIFSITQQCNYNCSYCGPRRHRGNNCKEVFPIGSLFELTNSLLNLARKRGMPAVEIVFSGGEPLLEWNTIREFLDKYHSHEAPRINTVIYTNGSLIDEQIASFSATKRVDIETSLDGNKESNDINRRSNDGRSAFQRTIDGLLIWQKITQRPAKRITYVYSHGSKFIDEEFVDTMSRLGISNVYLQLDYFHVFNDSVDTIINSTLAANKMLREKNIRLAWDWKKPFDMLMKRNILEEQPISFCDAYCGKTLTVLPDQSYACCDFSNKPFGKGSSLMQVLSSEEYRDEILSRVYKTRKECSGCEIEGVCMAGCALIDEYEDIKNIRLLKKQRCELLRQGTNALLYEGF